MMGRLAQRAKSRIRYSAGIISIVNRTFASLHARILCHATEELEKVERALRNVIGEGEIRVSRTEGVHGNPITVLQVDLEERRAIDAFFSRLSAGDLEEVVRTLDQRVDEERNLFVRVDKQSAFNGHVRLGSGGDVVSVRLRIMAFPAKREVAVECARDYLTGVIAAR